MKEIYQSSLHSAVPTATRATSIHRRGSTRPARVPVSEMAGPPPIPLWICLRNRVSRWIVDEDHLIQLSLLPYQLEHYSHLINKCKVTRLCLNMRTFPFGPYMHSPQFIRRLKAIGRHRLLCARRQPVACYLTKAITSCY